MIITCKLFSKESLHLLYGYNTFMHAESWIAFSYTLSKCDVKDCQRCQNQLCTLLIRIQNIRPAAPAPGTQLSKSMLRTSIRGSPPPTTPNLSKIASDCSGSWTTSRVSEPQQLDFLHVCTNHQDDWDEDGESDEDDDLMDELQSTIWKTIRKLRDPARPVGALREIVCTALPQNNLSSCVAMQYAGLLAPNVKIGVDWARRKSDTNCLPLMETVRRRLNERIGNFYG